MTLNEAIEIVKIEKLIEDIEKLLESMPFNSPAARALIETVNTEHSENRVWYNLLHYSSNGAVGSSNIPVANALDSQLKEDLTWKHYYLNAKLLGKTFDDIQKEFSQSNKH